MGRICTPNRLESMESETKKIKSIQEMIETTLERLNSFATKTDFDKIILHLGKCVKSIDFGAFLKEYNDYKSQMIDADELAVLQ